MFARQAIQAFVIAALLSSSPALAGPNEDAYAAVEGWVAAFNSNDIPRILATYTTDATLLGTTSPTLIKGPEALRAYFEPPAKAKAQVKLGEGTPTPVADGTVVWAGFYEVSGTAPNGQAFTTSARYTFVVVSRDGRWQIAHQHSSTRPKPPQ